MANETVARRYALAIFQLAEQDGGVDAVGRDLHTIADAIGEDDSTKGFFLSPVIDRGEKERVLAAAFAGKMHDVAFHALLLLVRKRREALLAEIVRQFEALRQRKRGAEPLLITSAKPLSGGEIAALVGRLEAKYGKRFEASQLVDASLIGGLRITLGDRRVDGSVDGRLQDLSRALFSENT